jgi:hypothetical protein
MIRALGIPDHDVAEDDLAAVSTGHGRRGQHVGAQGRFAMVQLQARPTRPDGRGAAI